MSDDRNQAADAGAKIRREREAAALRDNLRRRKEQQRARATDRQSVEQASHPPCSSSVAGDGTGEPGPREK